ncbi:MAG TPA: SapC family protein [Allosphingosinicella sp.]|uniref:SapC family protein n=1 Tax=Allosphingosinicella sp. TaxID=2823234 RepID=UPI002EDAEF66
MASQPPQMPIMYNGLQPLSNLDHKTWKTRSSQEAPFLAKVHAVPILIDEFVAAQRFYPIVFSIGDNPVPLALMGLNEGVNVFVDEKGVLLNPAYVPAYLRRYPFMLAKLQPDSDSLSLCFDPTSGLVGDFEEGNPLFDGDQPSETTQNILKFCEEFEMGAQRTNAFMEELKKSDLLMDGELTLQLSDNSQPAIYRGFRMVDENKLRDMRGDELRKINQNGILPLVMAHLFSLPLARDVYVRQLEQGKTQPPPPAESAAAGETVIA